MVTEKEKQEDPMLDNLQINSTYYFIGPLWQSGELILLEIVENWGSWEWADRSTQGHSSWGWSNQVYLEAKFSKFSVPFTTRLTNAPQYEQENEV